MQEYYKKNLISILVPTRNRPENVIKMVNSAIKHAENPNLIEFLFYVDSDDTSFPQKLIGSNVKVIYGPRVWLSIMQNVLYVHAIGEIIMYAADDIEFTSKYWDTQVLREFEKIDDRILLVYGNDLGSHGSKIAIHGFLHRNWVEAIGVLSAPSRVSLSDLWHTDSARKLNRLRYLPDLHIKHIHYRQGSKEATFDDTYKNAYTASKSWAPLITYRKLKRERRIDRILLAEKMETKPSFENMYILSELLAKYKSLLGLNRFDSRRIKTINNFTLIPLLLKNLFTNILKKS